MFAQSPVHPAASRLRPIFIGADGLRAGWSILLFLCPFALLYALGLALKHQYPASPHPAAQPQLTLFAALISESVLFAAVAGVAFLVSRIEERPFPVYGLGSTGGTSDLLHHLLQGLFWGAACLSLLIAALRLTHHIAFDGFSLHGPAIPAYALGWAAAFLVVALFEEFTFRGFLQYTATRGISGLIRAVFPDTRYSQAIGFWTAALLFSVGIFAFTHTANAGESPLGIVAVAAAGLTFAFSLWRTGNLWWAIGFHAAWDWAMSYLYGVADSGGLVQGHLLASHPVGPAFYSGGATGPEGSILVFPTLALAALIIHLTLPRRLPFTLRQDAPTNDSA